MANRIVERTDFTRIIDQWRFALIVALAISGFSAFGDEPAAGTRIDKDQGKNLPIKSGTDSLGVVRLKPVAASPSRSPSPTATPVRVQGANRVSAELSSSGLHFQPTAILALLAFCVLQFLVLVCFVYRLSNQAWPWSTLREKMGLRRTTTRRSRRQSGRSSQDYRASGPLIPPFAESSSPDVPQLALKGQHLKTEDSKFANFSDGSEMHKFMQSSKETWDRTLSLCSDLYNKDEALKPLKRELARALATVNSLPTKLDDLSAIYVAIRNRIDDMERNLRTPNTSQVAVEEMTRRLSDTEDQLNKANAQVKCEQERMESLCRSAWFDDARVLADESMRCAGLLEEAAAIDAEASQFIAKLESQGPNAKATWAMRRIQAKFLDHRHKEKAGRWRVICETARVGMATDLGLISRLAEARDCEDALNTFSRYFYDDLLKDYVSDILIFLEEGRQLKVLADGPSPGASEASELFSSLSDRFKDWLKHYLGYGVNFVPLFGIPGDDTLFLRETEEPYSALYEKLPIPPGAIGEIKFLGLTPVRGWEQEKTLVKIAR